MVNYGYIIYIFLIISLFSILLGILFIIIYKNYNKPFNIKYRYFNKRDKK